MLELVVENLDGIKVATVAFSQKDNYSILTDNEEIRQTIDQAIRKAKTHGLPLRFNKRQKTPQGTKFQRFACWIKPGDPQFLEALADYLTRFSLFAYTMENSVTISV